jgi:hypothetical protein
VVASFGVGLTIDMDMSMSVFGVLLSTWRYLVLFQVYHTYGLRQQLYTEHPLVHGLMNCYLTYFGLRG